MDVSAAAKMPGVRAILTGESAEAKGIRWHYQGRQVALFDPHCLFEGEAVAAVAGAGPLRANGYKLSMFQGLLEEELQKVKTGVA